MADDSRTVAALKTLREALALARDVAILIAIGVLVLSPERTVPTFTSIGRALAKAGFTKVSFAGFEQDLAQYQEHVQEARLDSQLAREIIDQLVKTSSIPPDAKEQLARAGALVGNSTETLAVAEQRAARVGQLSTGGAQPDAWVIVVGADRELSAAENEVRRAIKAGFQSASIVRRDGWYRTVVPMDSRTSAEAELPNVIQRIRNGAYIRNLADWCSSLRSVGDSKVRNCGGD